MAALPSCGGGALHCPVQLLSWQCFSCLGEADLTGASLDRTDLTTGKRRLLDPPCLQPLYALGSLLIVILRQRNREQCSHPGSLGGLLAMEAKVF